VSFVELLKQTRSRVLANSADPWRVRLERARGTIDGDGVERLSTQALFDMLDLPQRNRSSGASRRLAALMRDLGWTATKARSLNQRGLRDQVRGYARPNSAS
jgi:hypothetical protein